MTTKKYFEELKCDNCYGDGNTPIHRDHDNYPDVNCCPENCDCIICKGSGIIRGADITSTIKPILEGINKEINLCDEAIKYYATKKSPLQELGHQASGLEKAKQIILDNVIEVEE